MPYRWLDVERHPAAQALLEVAANIHTDDLPVLFFDDGEVLRSPEPRDVAQRLGRPLAAAFEVYDLVIPSAAVRRAWPPRSMARQRACRR